jgi:hypothetical protein
MKERPAKEVRRHSMDAHLRRTMGHVPQCPGSSTSSITSSIPEDAFKRFDSKTIKFMRSRLSPVTSLKIVNNVLNTFRQKAQSLYAVPVRIPDDLITQEECEDIASEVVGPQVTPLIWVLLICEGVYCITESCPQGPRHFPQEVARIVYHA